MHARLKPIAGQKLQLLLITETTATSVETKKAQELSNPEKLCLFRRIAALLPKFPEYRADFGEC